MKKLICVAWFISLMALGLAKDTLAQQCSPRMTAGKYVVTCDGFLPPAPGAPLLPAKLLSVATSDRHGNIAGTGTMSLGGTILQQTVAGTEQLNPDCTGSVTYQTWINGQPGPPLNITFVVSEEGDVMDGLGTDAGGVFACKLKRVSH